MTPYPWQAESWNAFESQLNTAKMPHAMLFSGAQGIGKHHFALCFVYRLFCHNVQKGIACGVCDTCHLLNIGMHPDLYQVEVPEGKQIIAVDQIRRLITNVNLKPHSAIKKVAIITQADAMNVNASNSLLKTLEEPPESCLLILITHSPQNLLATIKSRCQMKNFLLPETQYAINWLKSTIKNAEQADRVLALANGAPLQAVKYEESGSLQQRDELFVVLKDVLNGSSSPVTIASTWFKKDLDMTLYCMIGWITDMIRLKVNSNPPVLGNPDLKKTLLKFSEQSELTRMLNVYDKINDMKNWKKSNINAQSTLEEALVQWSNLNKAQS